MIHFELHTIDWNAISAMATTLALIVAYWSIHASNKQAKKSNEFQLKLLKKENEQKGLDEFIHKVIEIYDAVNPLDILNYSSKFMNDKFTDQDRIAIEKNANNDQINCIRLNVLMLQIDKLESAKSLIIELGDIRETYGYWMRNMNLISMYFDKQYLPNSKDFIVKAMQEMGDICIKFNPKYKSYIQSICNTGMDLKEQCLKILECLESELSMQLQQKRKNFEKHLYAYVKAEQMRINSII